MISPIIATQNSVPIAAVQHNMDAQASIANQSAVKQVHEEERQVRETVIKKDEAVFYQQEHDAKEEGKNKYTNLYTNKKKKDVKNEEKDKHDINRVNFDIQI